MQKGPVTPKGFGDVVPEEAYKRRLMINAIVPVLEKYGFIPLETPTIEFAETLLGKYGEEEKLIYQFEDKGGRKLALRYDLTVPLARFVANNLGLLTPKAGAQPTFSRYQIGQVFRGENPQKGRRREFTQFDFDVVGSADYTEDVRVISAIIESARAIGLKDSIIQINDRELFDRIGFSKEAIITIDKIDKIGRDAVIGLLKEIDIEKAESMFSLLEKSKKTERLKNIFAGLEKAGFIEEKDFSFNPYLARGLNYYTSTIFELKLDKTFGGLSVGGGGRYDNLLGMFAGRDIPAVGFSFGIDRIIDLLPNP
jgi:histidyl-tRNA synthetase